MTVEEAVELVLLALRMTPNPNPTGVGDDGSGNEYHIVSVSKLQGEDELPELALEMSDGSQFFVTVAEV